MLTRLMRPRPAGALAVCLLAAGVAPADAQDTPQAFVNARIIPIAGPEIPRGTLVVQNGRIVAVGPDGSVSIPSSAVRHDAAGKVLMPGFVDTHSHIGGPAGGDQSAALHPDVRVLDAVDARSPGFRRA